MNVSFLYTTVAISIFALGFSLGTIMESRRIRWLRLDELFRDLVSSRQAIESRMVQVEDDVRILRREVEYVRVDPETTLKLPEVGRGLE